MHLQGEDIMELTKFSTDGVQPLHRLDKWNEETSALFPGMTVDGSRDMLASWQTIRLNDTGVCLAKANHSKASRWIDSHDILETGRALIHLQIKGVTNTMTKGNSVICSSGEMTACHSDEPYELEISNHNECIVIDCPADEIQINDLKTGRLSATNNVHPHILLNFIQSIFLMGAKGQSTAEEEIHLEIALKSLLKNCLSSARNADPMLLNSTIATDDLDNIYKRTVEFINQHLSDSGIRTGQIARRLSVSEHQIQRAFSKFGTTPTNYIHNVRLEKAKKQLSNPRYQGSITDVALDYGFSDSAHFSRRFKSHFKMTPSQFQRSQKELVS